MSGETWVTRLTYGDGHIEDVENLLAAGASSVKVVIPPGVTKAGPSWRKGQPGPESWEDGSGKYLAGVLAAPVEFVILAAGGGSSATAISGPGGWGVSLPSAGGGGIDGDGVSVKPHAVSQERHMVTFDGEGGAALHHPEACAPAKADCPVEQAFQEITPAMRSRIGKWTCDTGNGGLSLLELVDDYG